jgi:hypothetical protein
LRQQGVVLVEEVNGFVDGEADAILLVEIVEEGDVVIDGVEFGGLALDFGHEEFLERSGILEGVAAGAADLWEAGVGVCLFVAGFILIEDGHFLHLVLLLAGRVVDLAAVFALLIG